MRVLISFGPTREYIDPVRFISNASSGMLGSLICRQMKLLGAQVYAVSGPVNPILLKGIRHSPVTSASEMLREIKGKIKRTDIFISCAAVSDYAPVRFSRNKIKKKEKYLTLRLKKNPDIIKEAKRINNNVFTAGFALETGNLKRNISVASAKMKEKQMNIITLNSAGSIGSKMREAYVISSSSIRHIKKCPIGVFAKTLCRMLVTEYNNTK